jgi:RNA polymerase sigma-70 factor (ECF subfamily)
MSTWPREAVQEAFTEAIRKRDSFRGEGPLEAWVWRTVVNAARKARSTPILLELSEHAETAPNGAEPTGELGALIAVLPERQRLALFLRYYGDLDYRSIAQALGVEVGTVSATLSSAHAALRRALQEVPR